MEKRLKNLKSQLHELGNVIHGTLFEIEKLESDLAPTEIALNKLKENKKTLKDPGLVVSIAGYSVLKEEIAFTELKFNKISNLLEKYRRYLDDLINKESDILDEIHSINEELDYQRKVLSFDINRKKNGQK